MGAPSGNPPMVAMHQPPHYCSPPSYGKVSGPGGGNRSSPYGGGAGEKPTNGMRPGDWCCPSCGNHNYASKMACNKCGVPKAALMGGMMPGMGGMMGAGMQGGKRPGDWKCYGCGNNNYASREECNKCGIPKKVFIKKSGMRPGDWVCNGCSNHNFSDKLECNMCKAPKVSGTVHTVKVRPGDWM